MVCFYEHYKITLKQIAVDLNVYLYFIIMMSLYDYDNEIHTSVVILQVSHKIVLDQVSGVDHNLPPDVSTHKSTRWSQSLLQFECY